jgi:2-methylisocitrate lyase-like PEP mutase family enzyme
VFVPGRLTEEQISAVTSAVPVPVNVLATPEHTVPGLAELGVRRISTGSLLFRVALDEAVAVARRLRDGGSAPGATPYGVVDERIRAYERSRRSPRDPRATEMDTP